MSFQVFGLPVSRGVAIGRAVLVASSRVDVAHYFIAEARIEAEIDRLRVARDVVATELSTLKRDLPIEAPAELSALLDVHLMLLHDDTLTGATKLSPDAFEAILFGNAGRTAELLALTTVVAGCGSAGVALLHRLETRLAPWRVNLET